MSESESKDDAVVESAVPDRRSFLRKAAGLGFTVPVIASFAMTGMMAGPAYAGGNLSV